MGINPRVFYADLDTILTFLAGGPFLYFIMFLLLLSFVGIIYMYRRACCRRESTASTSHHSTAQPISPAQSSKASTCRAECDNAIRQTNLSRASMSSRIYIARSVNTNEDIQICSTYKHIIFVLLIGAQVASFLLLLYTWYTIVDLSVRFPLLCFSSL